MSQSPLVLAARFALELVALGACAWWGWTARDDAWRFVLAIGLPALVAAAWGIFRVPGDPANAPVAVPGLVRLALEAAVFGGAVALLAIGGQREWALGLGTAVAVLYLLSWDRVVRLATGSQRDGGPTARAGGDAAPRQS